MGNASPRSRLVRLFDSSALQDKLRILGCWIWVLCLVGSPILDAADLQAVKARLRAQYPDVMMINATQLHHQTHAGRPPALVLDVRSAAEYRVSRLASAQHAETQTAALVALDGHPKDVFIVVYCSLGYRSAEVARQLIARGYTNVHNLEGSLFEWVAADYPVYRGEQPVQEVHPYNFWWGRYLRSDYRAYRPRP